MPERDNAVTVATSSEKLRDGVLDLANLESTRMEGSQVFTHYNGPTDQLGGICAGMAILAPGASPHPPHRHPEEEFLIVSVGTGEIVFASEIMGAGKAHASARAGKGGALVLVADRSVAQELLVTCPPLLEIFAGM